MVSDDQRVSAQAVQGIEGYPEELREKVKHFLDHVATPFQFLSSLGYSPEVSTCSTDLFPYCVEVVYGCSALDREVYVSFVPRKPGHARGDVLSVSVWKNLAAGDRGRGWDVEIQPKVYLSKVHPEFDVSKLDIRNHRGLFPQRLGRCLEAWASVLQNELRDIILGTDWVDGMYVTPFD